MGSEATMNLRRRPKRSRPIRTPKGMAFHEHDHNGEVRLRLPASTDTLIGELQAIIAEQADED